MIDHLGSQAFYEILQAIRDKPEVQDVLVEIAEVREQNISTWPFSEIIYILTSAVHSQVEAWLSILRPDEIVAGYIRVTPSTATPPLRLGMKVYSVWWD